MRSWGNLGVVETIYEEEYEYSSSTSSPFLSPTPSSPPHPLHSTVEAWTVAMGREADVLIRVHGRCFHLHKDPLISRSTYLKRQLNKLSELTLSPTLLITAETFSLVADFCYGTHVPITPFNVVALRIAAELLEMKETNGGGDENLMQTTETYFCRVVEINAEYALIVFRSCLPLLPEAETAAFLVSRCVETLSLTEEGDAVVRCFDDVVTVSAEDFQIVAQSMHRRLVSHDVLYKIVDFYLKEHDSKITLEQKSQICNSIDCNKLSPQLLIHAVQNPRMPLRFIVRAILVEQLNTRSSIISAAADHKPHRPRDQTIPDSITLGTILQRDAALRQTAQLKATMDATSSRIQTLERELSFMKNLLEESENERSVMESARSASFHYGSSENKIERGERGSVSSVSFRFGHRQEREAVRFSSSEDSCNERSTPRIKKIGKRFFNGLKTAFRLSNSASKH